MRVKIDVGVAAVLAIAGLAAAELLACSSSPAGSPNSGAPSDAGSSGTSDGGGTPAQGDAAATDSGGSGSTQDSGSQGQPDSGAKGGDGGSGPGCAGSSALFCEDFESGKLTSGTWTTDTQDGTATVDTMQAHSGTYAYHAHVTNESDARSLITEKMGFPVAHFFGRVFLWFDAPSPQVHSNYIFAYDQAGSTGFYLGSQYQQLQAFSNIGGAEGHSTQYLPASQYPNDAVPTGKWACIEWEFDGTGGTATYWLNGTQWDMETGWGSGTTFVESQLGIHIFGSYGGPGTDAASFDLWFDDLVIDTKRVGCN